VPIACQCILANCGANIQRPACCACVLRIKMPAEYCVTYPEIQVFAHTRLAIVSGPLMLLVNCFGFRVSSMLLLCSKVGTVYTPTIHKEMLLKCFCSSQCWSWANIDSAMHYCMTNQAFLRSCELQYSCGDDKLICPSPCWSCAKPIL